jgi:hypothetical protein
MHDVLQQVNQTFMHMIVVVASLSDDSTTKSDCNQRQVTGKVSLLFACMSMKSSAYCQHVHTVSRCT